MIFRKIRKSEIVKGKLLWMKRDGFIPQQVKVLAKYKDWVWCYWKNETTYFWEIVYWKDLKDEK